MAQVHAAASGDATVGRAPVDDVTTTQHPGDEAALPRLHRVSAPMPGTAGLARHQSGRPCFGDDAAVSLRRYVIHPAPALAIAPSLRQPPPCGNPLPAVGAPRRPMPCSTFRRKGPVLRMLTQEGPAPPPYAGATAPPSDPAGLCSRCRPNEPQHRDPTQGDTAQRFGAEGLCSTSRSRGACFKMWSTA